MKTKPLKKFSILDYGIYIMLALIVVTFSILSAPFRSINNLTQLLFSCTQMLVVATGVTYVIITGALDLSVGMGVLASAMLLNLLTSKGVNIFVAIIAAILLGTLAGFINGFVVTKLRCNAYLATYGMQLALRGFGLTISKGVNQNTSTAVKALFKYKVFGIVPLYFVIALLILLIAQYVLRYTSYGRKIIAVGCNEMGARRVGINSDSIRCSAFVISGTCAGIAGVLMAANVGTATTNTGSGYEFIAAAAVLMGGTSMYGGKGSIIPGTLIGVILLQTMENGLTILGIDPYYLALVRGALIFFAMFADSLKNRKK